jgi:hypothetical protein
MRFFEIKVLRRISEIRKRKYEDDGEDYLIRFFIMCTLNPVL